MIFRFYMILISFTLMMANAIAQSNSVIVISLRAVAGLKYDQLRFKVKPGTTVRLVLTNDDDMAHNLVITKPGAREVVVKEGLSLADKGPSMNYIPTSSNVLWAIPLVDPGQSKSITFKVPDTEGVFPYVCTFPGHGYVMFGAMYVTHGAMPAMKEDPHIPHHNAEQSAETNHQHKKMPLHPYNPVPPYLYRILMPDAGPAAIAVSLPQKLSYCWDAGACRLRYAWQGDFIDPVDYWDKKGESNAKVLGNIFYRDKTQFPIRLGEEKQIPTVKFKGYRLVNAYPEFHYSLNGMDVYEIIFPGTNGNGLERTFRIPEVTSIVWFIFDPDDGVRYTTSAGKFYGSTLQLTSQEAKHFTISMTKAEKEYQ